MKEEVHRLRGQLYKGNRTSKVLTLPVNLDNQSRTIDCQVSDTKPTRCAGFIPAYEKVVELGAEAARSINLSKICYDTSKCISRLTFVFSDYSRSPPMNFYDHEPKNICKIDESIAKMQFCSANTVLVY